MLPNEDPKDEGIPDFLDRKKTLPPKEYEAALAKAREATERDNRPTRPPVAPKAEKRPTASPKAATTASKKLPVPPPKEKRSVLEKRNNLQPPVAKQTPLEDVRGRRQGAKTAPEKETRPTAKAALSPSQAEKEEDTSNMATSTQKTAKRGVTSPAPKKVDPKTARIVKRAVKEKKARTAVKGKTTAKRPTEPREPRGNTIKILELASRKQGVSRAELIKLTGWNGAPWKWNFSNWQKTGYCDRFGYTLKILDGKDGETRYHVRKK